MSNMQGERFSTTALLKRAHEASDGKIREAMRKLDSWKFDHANAKGAIRVLRERLQKRPEAVTFAIERSGLVVVA